MSSFSFEVGITACSCIALLALRMRVSMSAIGSVSIGLPGRLGHARDRALVGELPQADAAEAELAERRPRPAAPVAAQVVARLVLLRPRGLHYERLLRHYSSPLVKIVFAGREKQAALERRERSYPEGTGATEDDALRRFAGRTRTRGSQEESVIILRLASGRTACTSRAGA